jgi:SpoVK/Ycf46/Vps4 family AAA+-type ATPase
MARSDHLKAMLRAHAARDESEFRRAALELVDEEDRKGHRLLARDLRRLVEGENGTAPPMPRPRVPSDIPIDAERGLPLAQIEYPAFGLERVVVSDPLRETLQLLIDEFRARELFSSYGLKHKRRVLFFGRPGCGKTLTARALAGLLDLPLLYVRFDSVISSYLGETAANLRRVFDYAQRGRWVVLFDEFDALGKARDDETEHGELKRVVNSLLQLIDGFHGDSLLVAATNHEHLLDPALWRRFDEIARFDPPDEAQRRSMLRLYLGGMRHEESDLRIVAADTDGMTGSDLERVAIEAVKQVVMHMRDRVTLDDLLFGLKRQRLRMTLTARPEELTR